MSTDTISRPLAPFGVAVDPDLILRPSETGTRELRRLFDEHGLLVFKRMELMSMEQQLDVCRLFGPVVDSQWENMLVSNTRPDGYLGAKELAWHHDLPYLPEPYIGGSLHALEVDDRTTSTRFSSGLRTWQRLPDDLRRRIGHLNALHVKPKNFGARNRLTDLAPGDVAAVHAVVRRQRNTDAPYVFVCEYLTDSLIGLSPGESDELLQILFDHLYDEEGVYEHSWEMGDLVVWDNETVQHARGDVGKAVRTLQRVSIARLGYAQMYPTDLGIYGDEYVDSLAQGTGQTKKAVVQAQS